MVVVMPVFSMIIPVLPFYVKSLGASGAAIMLAGYAVNLLAITPRKPGWLRKSIRSNLDEMVSSKPSIKSGGPTFPGFEGFGL